MSNNKKQLNFSDCVELCLSQEDFVEQYNRLTGSRLNQKGSRTALEYLIDTSCGYTPGLDEQEYFKFFAFVWDEVWMRLPENAFSG